MLLNVVISLRFFSRYFARLAGNKGLNLSEVLMGVVDFPPENGVTAFLYPASSGYLL